ncbi:hypothetical protein PILCRDRAFT_99203 [Piloderma croceum F 1598]|uniref:PABS domain-containing protein n=1 Tax=Piloderma croceum (strain F 1598) TaxID=765440 RepID=A0A0C3ENG3_PILCF|nr:hypothetical protein PILCRDRAFT_99203 [Piloderma croceum F 1598]
MIVHLPLASLLNLKKVLVIGGVVREVLKHNTAAFQVSKTYLPCMLSFLSSPRVIVFIGDGFKFLVDNESTYDVVIIDSFNPVGPIECLFEKPSKSYTMLSLQEDTSLPKMTAAIFPIAEYAYTTTPMYPSSQNSFMVCLQDAKKNLRMPDENVHNAAFILPEFGWTMVED